MIRAVQGLFALTGLGFAAFGLLFGLALGGVYALDPGLPEAVSWLGGGGMALIFTLMGAGLALVNLVVAGGLGQGQRWAWRVGVGLGVLYLPSGCLPLGGVLLLLLAQREIREYCTPVE